MIYKVYTYIKATKGRLDPVGSIVHLPTLGQSKFPGYILCNGQSVKISKYKDLYNVIGHSYSTKFTKFLCFIGLHRFNVPKL